MSTDVILAKWVRPGDRVLDVGNAKRRTRFRLVTNVTTHEITSDGEFEPFTQIVIYTEGGTPTVFMSDDHIEIEAPVEESA